MTHPLMRWECDKRGCFLEHRVPDWSVFEDCFPNRKNKIHVTDVDGAVEVGGKFLFIEWKSNEDVELRLGQQLFIERLSKIPGITVMVLWSAEGTNTRTIRKMQVWQDGQAVLDGPANLQNAQATVRLWAEAAEASR